MTRAELRRAIELRTSAPAWSWNRDLADRLLDDARDVPGALPLLSSAMVALWQHRDARTLRLSGYDASGGLRGAVARLAEQAYVRLDPRRRRRPPADLLRLVRRRRPRSPRPRRVPLADVQGAALDALAAARLVVIDDDRASSHTTPC